MLTRPEYHKLKTLIKWLEKCVHAHHEAWPQLAESIERHQDHACGALDVAHTFLPSVMMAISYTQQTVESIIELDDKGDEELLKEHHTNYMAGLVQEWSGINHGLIGIQSALSHLGIEIEAIEPPCTIETDDNGAVHVIDIRERSKPPALSIVPSTSH